MGEKSKFKITEAVKIFVRLHGFIINITPFRIVLSIVITCILGILPSVSVYTTQLIINQIQKKRTGGVFNYHALHAIYSCRHGKHDIKLCAKLQYVYY